MQDEKTPENMSGDEQLDNDETTTDISTQNNLPGLHVSYSENNGFTGNLFAFDVRELCRMYSAESRYVLCSKFLCVQCILHASASFQ